MQNVNKQEKVICNFNYRRRKVESRPKKCINLDINLQAFASKKTKLKQFKYNSGNLYLLEEFFSGNTYILLELQFEINDFEIYRNLRIQKCNKQGILKTKEWKIQNKARCYLIHFSKHQDV